ISLRSFCRERQLQKVAFEGAAHVDETSGSFDCAGHLARRFGDLSADRHVAHLSLDGHVPCAADSDKRRRRTRRGVRWSRRTVRLFYPLRSPVAFTEAAELRLPGNRRSFDLAGHRDLERLTLYRNGEGKFQIAARQRAILEW